MTAVFHPLVYDVWGVLFFGCIDWWTDNRQASNPVKFIDGSTVKITWQAHRLTIAVWFGLKKWQIDGDRRMFLRLGLWEWNVDPLYGSFILRIDNKSMPYHTIPYHLQTIVWKFSKVAKADKMIFLLNWTMMVQLWFVVLHLERASSSSTMMPANK